MAIKAEDLLSGDNSRLPAGEPVFAHLPTSFGLFFLFNQFFFVRRNCSPQPEIDAQICQKVSCSDGAVISRGVFPLSISKSGANRGVGAGTAERTKFGRA
jgi:hypothetical protein